MAVVTGLAQPAPVLRVVGVKFKLDQIASLMRIVVGDGGIGGPAQGAYGVAGEDSLAESLVASGCVWVAFGPSAPVGLGAALGAPSGGGH